RALPPARPMTERGIVDTQRLQALIVEHLYDGVIVTDPQAIIVDWNPAAERLFGYTKEEMLGKSATELTAPAEREGIDAAIGQGLAGSGRWTGEITIRTKQGVDRVVEAVVVPLRDSRGAEVGRISVSRDITDQRRAEHIRSAAYVISE